MSASQCPTRLSAAPGRTSAAYWMSYSTELWRSLRTSSMYPCRNCRPIPSSAHRKRSQQACPALAPYKATVSVRVFFALAQSSRSAPKSAKSWPAKVTYSAVRVPSSQYPGVCYWCMLLAAEWLVTWIAPPQSCPQSTAPLATHLDHSKSRQGRAPAFQTSEMCLVLFGLTRVGIPKDPAPT